MREVVDLVSVGGIKDSCHCADIPDFPLENMYFLLLQHMRYVRNTSDAIPKAQPKLPSTMAAVASFVFTADEEEDESQAGHDATCCWNDDPLLALTVGNGTVEFKTRFEMMSKFGEPSPVTASHPI